MSKQNGSTNGATSQAVIARDDTGRALRIRANGHQVELRRLDHSDLILLSCYDGDGAACEVNSQGICIHALEALFEAGKDAAVTITTCHLKQVAELLAQQVGGKVLLARSAHTPHGEGMLWVVAGNGKRTHHKEYSYV